MTENKGKATPQDQPADDQDVEGHSLMIDPTIAGDLARVRSKEIDRAVQERNRAKESKRRRLEPRARSFQALTVGATRSPHH